jgi:hypothetical protein
MVAWQRVALTRGTSQRYRAHPRLLVPPRPAPRHATRRQAGRRRGTARLEGHYSRREATRAAANPAPATPFRGTGRPSLLTYAVAAALVITAGLVVGVATGPTTAGSIAGHFRLTSSAGAHGTAVRFAAPFLGSSASPGKLLRSAAATGMAYPLASQSAGARRVDRKRVRKRSRSRPRSQQPATRPPQPTAAEQPIEIYDSATPTAIPAGVMCATYATGRFAVPAAEMAGRPTIWIDAWGTDPAASVLDVEPGDATPSMVPTWVRQHLALDPADNARIYTMLDEWSAVQQATSTLPAWMQARIRWWIADPTGVPHMVPGASATQWYWGPGYDISTANPGF